nr:MAG TPA: N-acetylmuramoyl-L-alanine amidase [Caudoviricetes sp.]
MSNSSLVNYTLLSPNHYNGRNHAIDTITIHCMAGNLTVERCGQVFQSRPASSNYGIGSDGRIAMYVEECNGSWCSSNKSNDMRAVTIEVANDGGESTGWHVSDAAMQSLINLCADICKRNGINSLKWQANKALIGQVDKQNMTVHRWFANKACPGEYLYSKHFYIADEVNKILNQPKPVIEEKGDFATMNNNEKEAYVKDLYAKYLGRIADQGGLNYWVKEITDKTNLVDFEKKFANNDEARKYTVTCAYLNVFNRKPDKSGLQYWMNWLKTNSIHGLYEQFNALKKNGNK